MKNPNKFSFKLLSMLLVLVMLVSSFASCTGGGVGTTTTTTPSSTTSTTENTRPNPAPSEHKDVDNDGFCDDADCKIDVVETIDFYNFNDTHGKLRGDTDAQPGLEEVTTYLENEKKNNEHTVILSSGDMWQGGAESYATKGAIINDWMNYLGFEAMAVGNHEFDWGLDYIEKNLEKANFPYLGINIYDSKTKERIEMFEPSVMIERGGVQIGIIGAMGDNLSSISGEFTDDFYFLTGMELTRVVMAESDKLRAQGADVVVYIYHAGEGEYNTMLSKDGYIDLVFEGHTHKNYIEKDSYGVYHIQNYGDNKYGTFAHVEMDVNFANGNVKVNLVDHVSEYDHGDLDGSDAIDDLLGKYREEVAWVERELGYNKTEKGTVAIEKIVMQLYYEAAVEKWGDQYDIALAGASINVRSPKKVPAGNVLYSDLLMILPFTNTIVLCELKGYEILNKFYSSSTYDRYFGDVIQKEDIKSDGTYYIVTDTYTACYKYNQFKIVDILADDIFACDLLAQFIQEGGWKN